MESDADDENRLGFCPNMALHRAYTKVSSKELVESSELTILPLHLD